MTFEGVPGDSESDDGIYTVTDFNDEAVVLTAIIRWRAALRFDLRVTEIRKATDDEIEQERLAAQDDDNEADAEEADFRASSAACTDRFLRARGSGTLHRLQFARRHRVRRVAGRYRHGQPAGRAWRAETLDTGDVAERAPGPAGSGRSTRWVWVSPCSSSIGSGMRAATLRSPSRHHA
jgi:hypothetical protein